MQVRCKEIKKFKSDLNHIPHMQSSNEIQELIDKIGFRGRNPKNYEGMKIEEIGEELREAMKFEQDTLEKIAVVGTKTAKPGFSSIRKNNLQGHGPTRNCTDTKDLSEKN